MWLYWGIIIILMLGKSTVILFLILGVAVAEDCFGEACAHRPVTDSSDSPNYREIATKIEE